MWFIFPDNSENFLGRTEHLGKHAAVPVQPCRTPTVCVRTGVALRTDTICSIKLTTLELIQSPRCPIQITITQPAPVNGNLMFVAFINEQTKVFV